MNEQVAESTCFERRVAALVDQDALLSPGEAIVVGVSGGMDSMVLASVLDELAGKKSRQYRLILAHLNHGLREESDDEAEFVKQWAGRHAIPCVEKAVDVALEAERSGRGIEETARRLRYQFLRWAALEYRATAVAVAHHGDDQAETVLFRALRGTSLRGLAGIPLARPMGDGVTLVRPLLHEPREELHAYALRRELIWREDPSNAETEYRRNYIRHELLPAVRERINPKVGEALNRLGELARETDAVLKAEATKLLERAAIHGDAAATLLDVGVFTAAMPIIRRTAIRDVLETMGMPMKGLTAQHLHDVDALATNNVSITWKHVSIALPADFIARREGRQLVLRAPEA